MCSIIFALLFLFCRINRYGVTMTKKTSNDRSVAIKIRFIIVKCFYYILGVVTRHSNKLLISMT